MKINNTKAFSLVEVVFALGLLSFAVVPLFGLLPVGINIFRDAIDTTVQSQIVSSLSNLAEQTEFSKLDGSIATKVSSSSPADAATPVYYYFDDEGSRITNSGRDLNKIIYTAALTYTAETDLPATSSVEASENMATLRINIYNNKGVFIGNTPVDPRKKTFMIHVANFGRRI